MACPLPNLNPTSSNEPSPPLTAEDLSDTIFDMEITQSELQLQADTLNVLEGRLSINDFTPERRIEIKNYYRFSASRTTSRSNVLAKRIRSTLEII